MLSDLTPCISLLATLTLGFAILNHLNQFCEILKNRFFHAEKTISEACKELRRLIPDKTTRDKLRKLCDVKKTSDNAFNDNVRAKSESLIRRSENAEKGLKEFREDCRKKLDEKCRTKSMASVCLFVFFVSVILLFVPLARHIIKAEVESFLFPFSIMCMLYVVLGWFLGENEIGKTQTEPETTNPENPTKDKGKDNKKSFREKVKGIWLKTSRRLCNYESLRHPFYSLLLIVVISIVFGYYNSNELGDSWKYLYVSLILVGWLNFAAYAVIIRIAINKFNAYVGEKKNELSGPFNGINNDYGKLIVFQEVQDECSPQSTISLKVPSPASTNKKDGNSPVHTSKPTRPRNSRHRNNHQRKNAADFTQKQEGTDTPTPPNDPE